MGLPAKTIAVGSIYSLVALIGAAAGQTSTGSNFDPPVRPGVTELVSTASDGVQGNANSGTDCQQATGDFVAVSDNARFVAFRSSAGNLAANDVNGTVLDDVFVKDRRTGKTELVSVTALGLGFSPPTSSPLLQSCLRIAGVAISGNGRFVAFSDGAPLMSDDRAPAQWDVFVYDRVKGSTELVSVNGDGEQANGDSGREGISLSEDGRFVAFTSRASNLSDAAQPPLCTTTAGLPTLATFTCEEQIYVHNRAEDTTELVSLKSDGSVADDRVLYPSISDDGRFVVFETGSALVPEDRNLCPQRGNLASLPTCDDVYLFDRKTDKTELVSVTREGTTGLERSFLHGWANAQAISSDGRYVLFSSQVTNLVPNQSISDGGYFVRDRKLDRTERVVPTSWGGNPPASGFGSISDDGRYVLGNYTVDATTTPNFVWFIHDRRTGQVDWLVQRQEAGNWWPTLDGRGQAMVWASSNPELVPGDGNDSYDVFVRDLGINKLGVAGFGQAWSPPAKSGDGALVSKATDITKLTVALRPELRGLYLKLDLDRMDPVIPGLPHVGTLYAFRFTVAGTDYEVRVQRTLTSASAPGGAGFVLLRCVDEHCVPVSDDLRGGYGTVGDSIVVSVPWDMLGSRKSLMKVSDLVAYTATSVEGSTKVRGRQIMDRVELDSVGVR